MAGTGEKDRKEKVSKARLFFRRTASRNKGWNGVAEINKWRDKESNIHTGKEKA